MSHARTLLCLALGASLQAAAPIHFGGAIHVNAPLADLKTDLNNKLGFGGSFQVSFETGERGLLRTRLDVDHFPVSTYDRSNSNYREEVGLNSLGVGADWLYAFSGNRNRGGYGLAGIGVLRWFQTFSATDHSGSSSWSSSDTKKNRVSPWLASRPPSPMSPRRFARRWPLRRCSPCAGSPALAGSGPGRAGPDPSAGGSVPGQS